MYENNLRNMRQTNMERLRKPYRTSIERRSCWRTMQMQGKKCSCQTFEMNTNDVFFSELFHWIFFWINYSRMIQQILEFFLLLNISVETEWHLSIHEIVSRGWINHTKIYSSFLLFSQFVCFIWISFTFIFVLKQNLKWFYFEIQQWAIYVRGVLKLEMIHRQMEIIPVWRVHNVQMRQLKMNEHRELTNSIKSISINWFTRIDYSIKPMDPIIFLKHYPTVIHQQLHHFHHRQLSMKLEQI